jgi:hypothetical protein
VRTVREVRACVPSPTIITSTNRPSCPRCGTDIVVDLVSRDPAPVRGKPPFAHCSGVGSVTPPADRLLSNCGGARTMNFVRKVLSRR